MTKYKLYIHSGVMYVVPIDKYEYVDTTIESYFADYCEGLHTTREYYNLVEQIILDNGGSCFDIWCDDYYVVMNKGGDSFADVLEIPLIDDSLIKIKPITSGLENCSIWWDQLD